MSKRILILNFSEDTTEEGMIDIKCHACHYNMLWDEYSIKTIDDLRNAINKGIKYDYIYLAGHGDDKCIGDEKRIILSWKKMSKLLCLSECLNEDAIMMLYCCRGGLNQVAYQIFASC